MTNAPKPIPRQLVEKYLRLRNDRPEMFKEEPGGCLIWQGKNKSQGYPVMMIKHEQFKMSRVAWTAEIGPITPGLFLLHSCDNPGCVSTACLREGTQTENMADRKARHRYLNTQHKGTDNVNSKLTPQEVEDIRTCYRLGVGQKILGAVFQITQPTVSRLCSGHTHILQPVQAPPVKPGMMLREKARGLYLLGLSYRGIARECDVSEGTVWNWTRHLPGRSMKKAGGK